MSRAFRRSALVAAAAVLVVLGMVTPTGAGWAFSATTAPTPVAAHPAAAVHAAAPRPAFTCPPANQMPVYVSINGFLPPVPGQTQQTCGNSVDQDTIHGTFSSSHPYSAERFTEPIYLPTTGSPGQSFAYTDVELGMVVGGDPDSAYRQSYAELYFTPSQAGPNLTVSWGISFAVWSMRNYTENGVGPGGCWNASLVVWNNSYWCVDDMMNGTLGEFGPTGIAGGSWYNVTFDGLKNNATGLRIWANDSTDPTPSNNFTDTLNATTTNTTVFEPYYNSSCPDQCYLNWSFPYGVGIGWDLCPVGSPPIASCDSYNQTEWDGVPSVAFGIPYFWANATAGYAGQYEYVAVVSGSAECASSAPVPVASCGLDYSQYGGTGFYPYFSWNGSDLNFGDTYPYTVEDLGGEYFEYIQTGPYQRDITPTFLDSIKDDSRAGFLRPGHALNVTAAVSDLGTVRSVHLNYTLNSGATSTLAMALTTGTAQRGVYDAEVPTGVNGWINYTVTVVSNAPATVVSSVHSIYRGPLPTFTVVVDTYPPSWTNATVNGTKATNGTTLLLNPGVYPIGSTSRYPYQFSRYGTTGDVSVGAVNGTMANLTVSGDGNVTAQWVYVTPRVTVNYTTDPTGCGGTTIDDTSVLNGGSISLLLGLAVALGSPAGCGGYSFAGWTVAGNLTVLGTTFVAGGNGTLTGNFVLTTSANTLQFFTDPTTCGAVLYRGAGYTNDESLAVNSTPYPIAPLACRHWGFEGWGVTGGASLADNNLTVTSAGSVTEVDYVLTEVTVLTYPASCSIQFDGVAEYNGTVLVVANNSTHTVTQNPCAGHYPFSVTVTTGMQLFGSALTVNDSGNVIATWLPGSAPSSFVEFETDPGTCGSIGFQGATWYNTNFTNVPANATGMVTAGACPDYGFVRWQASGGIVVPSRYASTSSVYINGSGSLEAVFRPLVSVDIQTVPSGCGTLSLNGVPYTNNGTADLTEYVLYPIQSVPCAHYSFVSWGNSIGAIVANGTVYLTGNAILTANFALTNYNVTVLIGPKACGSIYLNGASETNDSVVTLPFGTYPLTTSPCLGDVLAGLNASANLTIVGNHVTINGNGTLNATYVPVPPSLTLSAPTESIAGDAVVLTATVGVLIPPFTYNYTWTFGDGTTLTTPANFTEHTYASPGTYHIEVVVHDPFNRTANQSQTISIVAASGTGGATVPGSTVIVLALAGVAAVALLAVALWRRRPPTEPREGSSGDGGAADEATPEMSDGMAEAPPFDGQT